MILSTIRDVGPYSTFHPRITRALQFLVRFQTESFTPGREELDGETLLALRQEYDSKLSSQGVWESHRRYADIQFLYEGEEMLGYAPLDSLRVSHPYTADGDYALYEGEGQFFKLSPGCFAILFPGDAHMPGLAVTEPTRVRKIVMKVEL